MSKDDNSIRLTIPLSETQTFSWSQETPTPMMQFVRRDGKLILQQKWQTVSMNSATSEWRDVPIGEENNDGQ